MDIVIKIAIAIGAKLEIFYSGLLIGKNRCKSLIIAVASYIIEAIAIFLKLDFPEYAGIIVVELVIVALITTVYKWVKGNRNIINIITIISPCILIILLKYSSLEYGNVALMTYAWLLGGCFCAWFMQLVLELPDRRAQKIEMAQINDSIKLENAKLYKDIKEKCIDNIEEIKQEIESSHYSEKMIDDSIAKLRIKEYCSNMIVNQIIFIYEQKCKESDIKFDVDVAVDIVFKVDDLSLSSLMFNLLDNAYNYCVLDTKSNEKYISLKISALGDYSVVSVANSYSGKFKEKRQENTMIKLHGWGKIILSDIAKKYSGEFKTEISKTKYVATLILTNEEIKNDSSN